MKYSNRQLLMLMRSTTLFYTLVTSVCKIAMKKRHRRFAVRPMNRLRTKDGLFNTLIKDMLKKELEEDQFFKYTRMTKNQFIYLHNLVHVFLKRDPKKLHISSEQRLIMTLHYLSEGCSMQEIAWGYRVGKTTVRNAIVETCEVLWKVLKVSQLPPPTRSDFEQISNEYLSRWNIPNCIGAVDGKHVIIQSPKRSGTEFFNYNKSYSIILMACCDANMRFTMVDIGGAGANHDSTVFKQSGIGQALISGELDIPPPKALPYTDTVLPHFLVADAAFPLHINIIRPYPGSNLGEKKNIFNYRVSRARRTIESSFGILSQRWRILRKPIVASVEVCELIVQATVVLHNYLQNSEADIPLSERQYCPMGYGDFVDSEGNVQLGSWRREGSGSLRSVRRLSSNNPSNRAKNQRDLLSDFFVSNVGYLPWQEAYVNRGSIPE